MMAQTHSNPAWKIRPLSPLLGLDVTGADVRTIGMNGDLTWLLNALAEHGVVVFRDQDLTAAELVSIGQLMGELEWHVLDQYRMPDHPEIYVISNITENGKPIGNPKDGFGWHTDQAYLARPTAYTILYGVETPPVGAETLFVSTREAYAQLPADERAALADLRAIQSYRYMREGNADYRRNNAVTTELRPDQLDRVPDVVHPLVRTHPIDGCKSLYLGGDTCLAIENQDEAGGRWLIDRLFAHILAPDRVYSHAWRPKDVVLWDNRTTMHTATDYDRSRYRRLIWRLSVRGEVPY